MSFSIESILERVRLSRTSAPHKVGTCQICGKPGTKTRKKEEGFLFCSSLCNRIEFWYSELFQLGMKRRFEWSDVRKTSFHDLPSEIQGYIILIAYDWSINTPEEWFWLKHFKEIFKDVSSMSNMIDQVVIPNIRNVAAGVIRTLDFDDIYRFKGLVHIKIPYGQRVHYSPIEPIYHDSDIVVDSHYYDKNVNLTYARDWTPFLASLVNLTSLDLSDNIGKIIDGIVIDLKQLTNLSVLHCGDRLRDNDVRGLTRIRGISLELNSRITEDGLRLMKHLDSIDLYRNSTISGQFISSLTGLKRLGSLIILK